MITNVKKVFIGCLIISMLTSLVFFNVSADEVEDTNISASENLEVTEDDSNDDLEIIPDSGECGDGLQWAFIDGSLTISGSGSLFGYSEENPSPWNYYSEEILNVIIEKGLTDLSGSVFFDCDNLTDIYYKGSAGEWIEVCSEDSRGFLAGITIHHEGMHDYQEYGECVHYCIVCNEQEPIADGIYTVCGEPYEQSEIGYPDGWNYIDNYWYYYENNSKTLYWKKINDKWYYFDENGVMLTGWQKVSGIQYFLAESGVMVTGWQLIGDKWYYFKSSGAMASDEWVQGYWWVDKDGSWTYKYKGSWYKNSVGWWFGDTSGWYAENITIVIDDVAYTFDENGYWCPDYFEYSVEGETAAITRYYGNSSVVYIPDYYWSSNKIYPVTAIGNRAFEGNPSVKRVVMPDSVKTIGESAFRNCRNLSSIARKKKKEVYVFVGDSYGAGIRGSRFYPESNWIYYAAKEMGLKNYYSRSVGGMGFVNGIPTYDGGIDNSFYALLSQTGAPVANVTQVVIMGGYNDYGFNGEVISLFVQRVCNRARELFPNAVISVGMCSACAVPSIQTQVYKVADYIKQCTWYGCSYIAGIENVLSSNISGYISSDNIHPNDTGAKVLGSAVSDYLTNVLDFPAGLKSIGDGAFEGCSSVVRIIYNSNVSIGENSFSGCSIPVYPAGSMRTGWQKAAGKWYYFDSNGVMRTGWQKINGKWYYMQDSGIMLTGWQRINGTWYYFKGSGVMAENEWAAGYWLSSEGAWKYKYKGSWHLNSIGWWFGDDSGWYARNETIVIDDKEYSFDSRGYMK